MITCRYPIVIVTETLWNEGTEDSELMLPGYILFRCERDVKKHGGVLVVIQKSIKAEQIREELTDKSCILTKVYLQLKKYLLCIIHNPPQVSAYR